MEEATNKILSQFKNPNGTPINPPTHSVNNICKISASPIEYIINLLEKIPLNILLTPNSLQLKLLKICKKVNKQKAEVFIFNASTLKKLR